MNKTIFIKINNNTRMKIISKKERKVKSLSSTLQSKKIEANYNELFKKIVSIFDKLLTPNNNNNKISFKTNQKEILKTKQNILLNKKRKSSNPKKNKKKFNKINQSKNKIDNQNIQIFKVYYKCKVYCMKFILQWLNKTLKQIKCKETFKKLEGKIISNCQTKFNLNFINLELKNIFNEYKISTLYRKKKDSSFEPFYNKQLIEKIYSEPIKFEKVIKILNLTFKNVFNNYWKMKSTSFKLQYKMRNKYLLNSFLLTLKKKNKQLFDAVRKFVHIDIELFLKQRIIKK